MAGAQLLPFIGKALGINDVKDFVSNPSNISTATDRFNIKVIQMMNHLFTFLLPSVLFVIFVHKNKAFQFLRLNKFPSTQQILMGSALIFMSFFVAQALLKFNQMIPLPSSATNLEEKASTLTNVFLVMNTPSEMLMTFLAIAILPAIGEELMFRGIFQRYLYRLNNAHLAIFITGFLFSVFHFQFEGFLPRFFLGVILGYLYYWSGSLWLPILAHLLNNGIQVLGVYYYKQQGGEIDAAQAQDLPWIGIALATVLTVAIIYWFIKKGQNNKLDTMKL
jgi:membrane protease YdiL (CAAX protease family)